MNNNKGTTTRHVLMDLPSSLTNGSKSVVVSCSGVNSEFSGETECGSGSGDESQSE